MRKLVLSIAALAAIGVVLPYSAPAQAQDKTVIIKHHGDRDFHRHHHKVVIIKRGDHDHY